MAVLRLFANLRETAGTGRVDIEGATVGDILDDASKRYGETFEAGLETAQLWVNGEPADRAVSVANSDEIAVIPPVSGGTVLLRSQSDIVGALLVFALLAVLVIANRDSTAAFVIAVVGVTIAWLWDLADAYQDRGLTLQIIPSLLSVAAAANAAFYWGTPGFAGGLALGLAITLVWTILDPRQRTVQLISLSALLSLLGGLAAGALVMVQLRSSTEVAAFLFIATVAALAGWGTQRFAPDTVSIDPNLAALIGAVVAGLIAGATADTLELATTVLAAAITGGGILGGRTIGSLVRNGAVIHTVRAPGLLTSLDGPAVGAVVFWVALVIFG